jgi:hypothetical protein
MELNACNEVNVIFERLNELDNTSKHKFTGLSIFTLDREPGRILENKRTSRPLYFRRN